MSLRGRVFLIDRAASLLIWAGAIAAVVSAFPSAEVVAVPVEKSNSGD